jgi:sugar lactone lactonase YvrE
MEPNPTDIHDLIADCKTEYQGNDSELNKIRQFQEKYSSNEALWWYTRESFYYKTLNKALRSQNIHMIFLYRSFITDIYRQLKENPCDTPLRVYRSQLMTKDELKELKRLIGQFISVNSFLSTSKDRSTALFLAGDATVQTDMERVLFEIDADPIMASSQPFADISILSEFDESEVLFMVGSIFRLNGISFDVDQGWIIQMSLCSGDEHEFKDVLAHMKQQNGSGPTNLRTFGKVLWQMGKLDLVEKYFERLLTDLPPNDPVISNVYEDLAQITSQKGDFDSSIKWRQKFLAFKNQHQFMSTAQIESLCVYPNIKWVQDAVTVAGGNKKGNGSNQLFYPWGLTIDHDQTIYVADCVNDRIMEWKPGATSGQIVAGGNEGRNANQLDGPRDVIIDREEKHFIICDSRNHRVLRWPRKGGTHGETIISNVYCFSVAMSTNGLLYVCDVQRDEVKRWRIGDTHGAVVAGGNGKGNRLDQLHGPTFIFVDQDESVYVSDSNNHRVMKWMKDAKEGILAAGDQGPGNSLTQLHNPQGIAVDQTGTLYVADYRNDRIMYWPKEASHGSIAIGVNGQGNEANQLSRPRGLSFDRQGNLYVIDHWNHRVQRFSLDVHS